MSKRLVITNSAWLMADKLVRMGVGLVVWVWLARRFGPEGFGLWNYAIAFTALFSAVAGLGLDGIVVRELLRQPDKADCILGTSLALRLAAGTLAALASTAVMAMLRPGEWLPLILVAFNAVALVLQNARVTEFHFQAHMRARPAVTTLNIAFLITTVFRLILLAADASIEWFGMSLVLEAALATGLLVLAYRKDTESRSNWRFDRSMARTLLVESWPLLLSGLAVMVYMRLDQVMLAAMVGDEAVGQFSAALRIAEVWYFIPMAIITATFPSMISKREQGLEAYERYVQSLYDGMAWLGLTVAIVTTLIAPWLIAVLYGPGFAPAAAILSVQIWAGVTVSMSFVHGKWLLAEGLQKYSLLYTVLGACVNVSLNLILIRHFGVIGAAWATLVTQIGLMPVQLFFPKARRNFVLMIRTISAPIRLMTR